MLSIFYRIEMKISQDKKLYLKADIGNRCKWTNNINECIWFDTETEAQTFCKHYFKNFNNYIIKEFEYNI